METKTLKMAAALIAALAMAGCATPTEFLNSKQEIALRTVLTRARFDMDCQEATGTVLSREVIQPPLRGPARAEFMIGVTGCDKRHTYVVVCPDGGEGCFATRPGGFLREEPASIPQTRRL